MTLRKMVLDATPVGRRFTCHELTCELFPELKINSAPWDGKRSKIAIVIREEATRWGRYRRIGELPGSGRAIIWERVPEELPPQDEPTGLI